MDKDQKQKRRDYLRKYYKQWRLRNPSKANMYHMRWRKKNAEKFREYQRNYQWSLPKNNHMRIGRLLRTRINAALNGAGRHLALTRLLGCGLAEFRKHIEAQFTPEMSWENHGDFWHIDHIKPCASFDLTTEQGQRECFHFSNHQPLPATENLRKSDGGRRRRT